MLTKIIILILMAIFYVSYFEQAFGEEYLKYKNKVFRYVGRNF